MSRYQDSMKDLLSNSPLPSAEQREKRSSNTFESKVFAPVDSQRRPMSAYKPTDSLQSLGQDSSDFYRKDLGPEYYEPNFVPRFNNSGTREPRTASRYKPSDSFQSLGRDQPDFYRKEIGPPAYEPNFVPQYKHSPASKRKLYDIHGPCHVPDPPAKEKTRTPEPDFKPKYYGRSPQKPKEVLAPDADYSPENRRDHLLSSNIFGDSAYRAERRTPYVYRETQRQQEENDSRRRQNHLYSDLFGTGHHYDRPSKPLEVEPEARPQSGIRPSVRWTDDPVHSSHLPMTASRMKAREQCSSFQSAQDTQTQGQPELMHLSLSNVPGHFNEQMLKSMCTNVHIVNVHLDFNNLTGLCTGTGSLTLRTSESVRDMTSLRYALSKQRVEVTKREENLGLRNNYSGTSNVDWLDPKLEKPARNERGARESMLNNLESSSELFGDVGRFGNEWKQGRGRAAIDPQFVAETQWNNMLKPRKLF